MMNCTIENRPKPSWRVAAAVCILGLCPFLQGCITTAMWDDHLLPTSERVAITNSDGETVYETHSQSHVSATILKILATPITLAADAATFLFYIWIVGHGHGHGHVTAGCY